MTPGEQTRVFLAMMLCGACAGGIHDLLTILRHNVLSTAAADLLLGVLCAAGVIGVGLMLGCDPFRLYTLAGVVAGFAIYTFSLGTIVRIMTKHFIKLSKKVAN